MSPALQVEALRQELQEVDKQRADMAGTQAHTRTHTYPRTHTLMSSSWASHLPVCSAKPDDTHGHTHTHIRTRGAYVKGACKAARVL